MRRDDPKVLETVERLLKEGKSQRQVSQLVDEMLAVDPPFRTRDNFWAWLRRQRKRKGKSAAVDPKVEQEKARIIERAERQDFAQELRKRARIEILGDYIKAAVALLPPPEPVPPPEIPKGPFAEEAARLLLSDAHTGYWLPIEKSGGLWSYDFETFQRYCRRIVEKVGIIIPRHNYPIRILYVAMLGDWVENVIMRLGQRWEVEFGLVKQVILAAKELAEMLRGLLAYVERIELDCLPGNHGRMSQNYGELPAGESFDLLVGEFVKAYLASEPRVTVRIHDTKRQVIEVFDWRILMTHGDGIRGGFAGVPHYGRDRHNVNISALYEDLAEGIDIIEMGHFHDPHEGTFRTWGRYFVNGSFTGATNYSIERLNRVTQPAQWLYGISPERPVTWQYLLTLADMPPRRRRSP